MESSFSKVGGLALGLDCCSDGMAQLLLGEARIKSKDLSDCWHFGDARRSQG